MPQHSLYGEWTEGWIPALGYPKYEVNHLSEIRNVTTKRLLKPDNDFRVWLYTEVGKDHKYVYFIALTSFFPNIPRLKTIDHFIENNRKNNHINNLQWMTLRENLQKSHIVNPRKSGLARAKAVEQWTKEGKVAEFMSTTEAMRVTGIQHGNISACADGRYTHAGNFIWKWKSNTNVDLEGEIWATSDRLKSLFEQYGVSQRVIEKVRISNKGRVMNTFGKKTKGHKQTYSGYRKFKMFKMHQLVWSVFGDRAPKPGEYICHNDMIPKDENGCMSNAIEHLRLDTPSNNIKESHLCGMLSKYHKSKA